jgi:serine/threonine-protein kinase
MNGSDRHIMTIFSEALERSSPEERAAYLDAACGRDPELRARVEALLRAHQQAGQFLQGDTAAPPPVASQEQPLSEGPGTVIGPYKLLEPIGEGGFGVVFLAEQQQPVRRQVALKVLKPGMDSRQVVARFEAERQALALMDHPHIAHILDGGATASGRPYFVMELVRGTPITSYCDHNRLPVRQRLELFVGVCQAVQHAHQKGVIHRDLKPSNILVTRHDDTPVVKVIDFGIAKALGQQLTDKTLITGFAQMIGTPLYMSPEQASLNALDVDTRSDVYALGVLLYELLTGTTPFDKERLRQVGFDAVLRIIREEEAPKPSTRISTLGQAAPTVAEQRQIDPKRLSRLLRGELDWIVLKALEKDRNRRYESASALAADVQRHLHHEPVQACPPSATYLLRKFARRHKARLALAAGLAAVLAILTASLGWILRDLDLRRTTAESLLGEALRDAEPRLREGNPWDPILISAARKAEAQLASGVIREELRRQVQELLVDLNMLARLEQIRLDQPDWKDNKFDTAGADPAYARAFREYGIDVEALGVQEAAEQISQRVIGIHLVVALDDWANVRKAAGGTGWKQLLEMAKKVDPDPWRCALREAQINERKEDLEQLAAAAPISTLPPTSIAFLGNLFVRGQGRRAKLVLPVLREGQRRHPAEFWINHTLARVLLDREPSRLDEAIGFYRVALALRPQCPGIHLYLAIALNRRGQLDEAIQEFREAIRLDPKCTVAQTNLGGALEDKGQWEEAILEYRAAIALNPKHGLLHARLGNALRHRGQPDEAIQEYRVAIALAPKNAWAHNGLGDTLRVKGQLDEAIQEYRDAIRLDPKYFTPRNNLCATLMARGQLDEAIQEYREVLRLNPKYAYAHLSLGNALKAKGKRDEAIQEYREAVGLDPEVAMYHISLGFALRHNGQYAEALASLQRGHELGSKRPDWKEPSAEWVRQAEQAVALDQKLQTILRGEAQAANVAEGLKLAQMCHDRAWYVSAARFWSDAFAADPQRADDLRAQHRYNAACAAALAGAGKAKDDPPPDEPSQAQLRRQARDWLQADLAAYAKLLDGKASQPGSLVQRRLQHWKSDSVLAGLRGQDALAQLPAEEQEACRKLWAEVEALLQKAREQAKP